MRKKTKLVIFNVKYSPNLGDGIIAECLEYALRRHRIGWAISSCDVAGRQTFGTGLDGSRRFIFAILDRLPRSIRRMLVKMILKRLISHNLRDHYARSVAGADLAVTGGGQLLADADLNFPMKLSSAARQARKAGAKTIVFGVGVAKNWSDEAADMFHEAFAEDLTASYVRDEASARRWTRHFGKRPTGIVRDPGLLSCECYGPAPRPERERPMIGLGIANPKTLCLHADQAGVNDIDYIDFFATTAMDLRAKGFDVTLFTNGPSDDQNFLKQVVSKIPESTINIAPSANTPGELAHLIGSFDGLIAHRLHANVIAYSYKVPHVGLGWDSKVPAFFESVGRSKFALAPEEFHTAVDRLAKALSDGIDETRHAAVLEETDHSILTLAETLEKSLQG